MLVYIILGCAISLLINGAIIMPIVDYINRYGAKEWRAGCDYCKKNHQSKIDDLEKELKILTQNSIINTLKLID